MRKKISLIVLSLTAISISIHCMDLEKGILEYQNITRQEINIVGKCLTAGSIIGTAGTLFTGGCLPVALFSTLGCCLGLAIVTDQRESPNHNHAQHIFCRIIGIPQHDPEEEAVKEEFFKDC